METPFAQAITRESSEMAETETTDAPTEQPPAKRGGLMKLIKAVACVSIIVLLQVVAASMIIPSADETQAIAERIASVDSAEAPGETTTDAANAGPAGTLALSDMVEVNLGSFHVLTYNPESGTSLNIDFELFGTVLDEEEGEFYQLFDAHQRRIREQILITIRGTKMTDLTDAGLGLIKRIILEKTNRALGKPLLHEAIFSRFSFEER